MNQPDPSQRICRAWKAGSPAPPPPSGRRRPARPRVKPVDRSQLTWQMLDVERLIEQDHPARAIWELVGRVKLEGFYAPIEAVEGSCRPHALGPAAIGEPVDLCLQPGHQFGAGDRAALHL